MKSHLYDCEHCGRADRGMDAEGNEEYYCKDKYNGNCHYEGIGSYWLVKTIKDGGQEIQCNECETVFRNPNVVDDNGAECPKYWKYCPECRQLMCGRYKFV